MKAVILISLMLSLIVAASFLLANKQTLQQRVPGGGGNTPAQPAVNNSSASNTTNTSGSSNTSIPQNYSSNGTATIYQWANCLDSKCNTTRQPNVCLGTDRACLLQSYYFSTCILSNDNCNKWNDFFQYGKSNDNMPDSYFTCQEACKPQEAASPIYYASFECGRQCAAGN